MEEGHLTRVSFIAFIQSVRRGRTKKKKKKNNSEELLVLVQDGLHEFLRRCLAERQFSGAGSGAALVLERRSCRDCCYKRALPSASTAALTRDGNKTREKAFCLISHRLCGAVKSQKQHYGLRRAARDRESVGSLRGRRLKCSFFIFFPLCRYFRWPDSQMAR